MLKITNMVLEISCLDCIIARTPTINTLPKPLALSCYPDVFWFYLLFWQYARDV